MTIRLTIEVDVDGDTSMDISGATGKDCLSITKPFEDALGKVTSRSYKPEFRRGAKIQTDQTIKLH